MNNDLKSTKFGAACGIKKRWEIEDVIAEFDSNWNITLAELSRMSMWDIEELKELLLKG